MTTLPVPSPSSTRSSILRGPVLAAVDGSEQAAFAARAAARIAAASGVSLHLVHAVREPDAEWGEPVEGLMVYRERRARRLLADGVAELERAGGRVDEAHLLTGSPTDAIVDAATAMGAGLIVVGSHGTGHRGGVHLHLGSVAEGLVHHGHHPVLVLRGEASWPPARVVAGDDGSPGAAHAAELAAHLAALDGARVLVVRAVPDLAELLEAATAVDQTLVAELLHTAEHDLEVRAHALSMVLGVRPGVRVVVDEPGTALLEAAQEGGGATLVAVGSRGLGPVRRLRLGSVSTAVLRGAPGAVLVVPTPPADDG